MSGSEWIRVDILIETRVRKNNLGLGSRGVEITDLGCRNNFSLYFTNLVVIVLSFRVDWFLSVESILARDPGLSFDWTMEAVSVYSTTVDTKCGVKCGRLKEVIIRSQHDGRSRNAA